jgi:hypothetical protein
VIWPADCAANATAVPPSGEIRGFAGELGDRLPVHRELGRPALAALEDVQVACVVVARLPWPERERAWRGGFERRERRVGVVRDELARDDGEQHRRAAIEAHQAALDVLDHVHVVRRCVGVDAQREQRAVATGGEVERRVERGAVPRDRRGVALTCTVDLASDLHRTRARVFAQRRRIDRDDRTCAGHERRCVVATRRDGRGSGSRARVGRLDAGRVGLGVIAARATARRAATCGTGGATRAVGFGCRARARPRRGRAA